MVLYLYNYVGVGDPGGEKVMLTSIFSFVAAHMYRVVSPFNLFKCALSFIFDRFIFKMYDYVYIYLAETEEC